MTQPTHQTRRERRRKRSRVRISAKEARLAARLAGLGYKIPGPGGALKVPTKPRLNQPMNDARNGASYVVAAHGRRLPKPVVEREWRPQHPIPP